MCILIPIELQSADVQYSYLTVIMSSRREFTHKTTVLV